VKHAIGTTTSQWEISMSQDSDEWVTLDVDFDKLASNYDRCVVRDGCIVLDGNYEIALDRCDTPEKILACVCHLSSKRHFFGLIEPFIRTSAEVSKIEVPEF